MQQLPTFNEITEKLLANSNEYVRGALGAFLDTTAALAPTKTFCTVMFKDVTDYTDGKKYEGYVIVLVDEVPSDPTDIEAIMDEALMKRFVGLDESGKAVVFLKLDEAQITELFSTTLN